MYWVSIVYIVHCGTLTNLDLLRFNLLAIYSFVTRCRYDALRITLLNVFVMQMSINSSTTLQVRRALLTDIMLRSLTGGQLVI